MAQNLQGLSYVVCSADIAAIFALRLFILVFGICAIIHQHLVAMLREFMRFVCSRTVDIKNVKCFCIKGASNRQFYLD